MRFLEPYQGHIYALVRILAGLLFLCHGLQKIFGLFGGAPAALPGPLLWTAGLIELIGGALIAVGLFTGPAAFVCSGMMAVGYFMAHQPQGAIPILNQGELAVLYCWLFLYIAARGAGRWSVDGAREGAA